MKKKVLSLALAGSIVLGSVSFVSAADPIQEYHLINNTNAEQSYSFVDFVGDADAFDYVGSHMEEYTMLVNGKQYDFTILDANYDPAKHTSIEDAIAKENIPAVEEEALPAVEEVTATVNNDAKEITVGAVLKNINAAIEVIEVELKELNEDGELVALTSPVAADTIDEDNDKLTAVLDVKDVKSGDYVVVVTVGDLEGTEEVSLDFTAVDAKVAAVNKAATEITLEAALTEGGFDFIPANIKEYREKLGKDNVKDTVKEIEDAIVTANDDAANKALAKELKEIATDGTQKALLNALNAAKFEDVLSANINEYQIELRKLDGNEEKSDIQEQIIIINAERVFAAKDAALTAAIKEIETPADAKQADVDAAIAALTAAEEALAALKEIDTASASKTITETDAQDKIDAAQLAIDTAGDAVQALADAKLAAKTAQAEFAKAGGSKGAAVYVALTTATNTATTAADLTEPTKAVTDATTALGLYNTAVTDAKKAIADHIAAGGKADDTEAAAVTTALTVNAIDWTVEALATDLGTKTTTITGATTDLTAETVKLTAVRDAKVAAEKAMADYLAAGGLKAETVYTSVETALAGLTDDTINTLTPLVTALNEATKELVDVKAINDAITNEDVGALQEIILGVGSTTFADLSKAQRAELGEYIINQAKNAEVVTVYEKTEDFKKAIDTTDTGFVAKYQKDITAFNTAANDTTVDGVTKQALVEAIEELVDLEGLSPVDKLDLAEAIFAAQPEGGYAVQTIAQIKDIVETTPYSLR